MFPNEITVINNTVIDHNILMTVNDYEHEVNIICYYSFN